MIYSIAVYVLIGVFLFGFDVGALMAFLQHRANYDNIYYPLGYKIKHLIIDFLCAVIWPIWMVVNITIWSLYKLGDTQCNR